MTYSEVKELMEYFNDKKEVISIGRYKFRPQFLKL